MGTGAGNDAVIADFKESVHGLLLHAGVEGFVVTGAHEFANILQLSTTGFMSRRNALQNHHAPLLHEDMIIVTYYCMFMGITWRTEQICKQSSWGRYSNSWLST